MSEAERKVEALTQQIEEQMELQEKHGEYYGETWGSARGGWGGGIGTGARGRHWHRRRGRMWARGAPADAWVALRTHCSTPYPRFVRCKSCPGAWAWAWAHGALGRRA